MAATERDRFARTPPTPNSMKSASRAAHDDMREVLGLHDAPAQWPATEGAAGQHRKGAIGGQHVGHKSTT